MEAMYKSGSQTTLAPMTLAVFARLVANLYRHEPDECVITLGDWQSSPVADRAPLFHGTLRVTVGDFRRWAPDHVRGGPI